MLQTMQDVAQIIRDLAPMGAVYVSWLGIKDRKKENRKEKEKLKIKKRVKKYEKKKAKTKNKKLTKVGKP